MYLQADTGSLMDFEMINIHSVIILLENRYRHELRQFRDDVVSIALDGGPY